MRILPLEVSLFKQPMKSHVQQETTSPCNVHLDSLSLGFCPVEYYTAWSRPVWDGTQASPLWWGGGGQSWGASVREGYASALFGACRPGRMDDVEVWLPKLLAPCSVTGYADMSPISWFRCIVQCALLQQYATRSSRIGGWRGSLALRCSTIHGGCVHYSMGGPQAGECPGGYEMRGV